MKALESQVRSEFKQEHKYNNSMTPLVSAFILQLFASLVLSALVVFTITLWLTKHSSLKRQAHLESIPHDATSHSDRDVVEPKPAVKLAVRVSPIIR